MASLLPISDLLPDLKCFVCFTCTKQEDVWASSVSTDHPLVPTFCLLIIQALHFIIQIFRLFCFHAGLTITEVNKRRFCFFFSSLSSPPTLLCSANWLWTEALQVIRMLSACCWEREVPETAGPAASWKPLGLRQNPHLILFSLQPILSLSFAPVEVLLGSLLSLEFSSLVLLQLWLAFICVCSFFFLSCFII